MQELELLGQYLLRLRQERLQQAHAHALHETGVLVDIKIRAHEAELCSRIYAATRILAKDAGQFIKEFLT